MVEVSQTTILGLAPSSPVAISEPSGCIANEMMSSVWSKLYFCV